MTLEPLVDTKAAANFLGIQPNVLEQWRCFGRGPRFVRIGRLVKYAPSDLRAYVSERTRNSNSEAA